MYITLTPNDNPIPDLRRVMSVVQCRIRPVAYPTLLLSEIVTSFQPERGSECEAKEKSEDERGKKRGRRRQGRKHHIIAART